MLMVGKGLGLWNTTPICRRTMMGSVLYIAWSSSRILPETLALGINSCIRLMQRIRVVFPHPEGPMIAVRVFREKDRLMSFKTVCSPKEAEKFSILRHVLSLYWPPIWL